MADTEPQDDDEGREALAGAPVAEAELPAGEVPAELAAAGEEE